MISILLILCIIILAIVLFIPEPEIRQRPSARGYCHMDDPWEEPLVVHNIITHNECQEIIKTAEPYFDEMEKHWDQWSKFRKPKYDPSNKKSVSACRKYYNQT